MKCGCKVHTLYYLKFILEYGNMTLKRSAYLCAYSFPKLHLPCRRNALQFCVL